MKKTRVIDPEILRLEIAKLALGPTDTLVIRVAGRSITRQEAEEIRRQIAAALDHNRLLVIPPELDLSVVRPNPGSGAEEGMTTQNTEYVWDWFDHRTGGGNEHDLLSVPPLGTYGVRRGREIICLTNRYSRGYEQAVSIAEALNRAAHIDSSGASDG